MDVLSVVTEDECLAGSEEKLTFEYSVPITNRFEQRQDGGPGGFETVNRKRKKQSSGSTHAFVSMSTDEKLICIF
ncbi:hypothetical protein DPMN_168950 [Dreissena polymorpha]|uniref:Uncharacterized protein n=1 Tax=Dreissena polymorpha TaxID=45954 RepID=A0A9D4J046_DREPO|nr:hypothetical protein DPMN_168950 [Dreissena polymorpha]